MKDLYNTNADFREYVKRHCEKHKISVEEALQHSIVKEVAKYKKAAQEGKE